MLLGRGGVAAVQEGAEESRRSPGGRACCHPPCLGRSRERGTRCRLPSTGGAIAIRQEAEGVRPSTKDVQYHRMAPRVRASQLVEDRAQRVREPDRDFFFFFSLSPPLSRPCLLSSFRLLFSSLVCPYPQVRRGRPDGPPWEGGGSRAQSRGYPPACEGRWGYVTCGGGREPWERSEAGGVNDMSDTCATHRSRVPRRSSGR